MSRIIKEIRGVVEMLLSEQKDLSDYHVEINHADMVQVKRAGYITVDNTTSIDGIEVRLNRKVHEPMLVHKDN